MAPRRQNRNPNGAAGANAGAARGDAGDNAAVRGMVRAMQEMFERMNGQGNAGHGPDPSGGQENARFESFRRSNPQPFRGTTNPDKADEWIQSMEKIFSVVMCSEEQKVTFAAFMLEADADYWWKGARRLLEAAGTVITWELFKTHFYEKFFPESVKNAKDVEFMRLVQGDLSIAQYTARFEDLIKFSRVFQGNPDEYWKCVKYEAGLKPELNLAVAHMEIRDFPALVNKCRILEEGHKRFNAARTERAKGLAPQAARFKPQHQAQSGDRFNPQRNLQFRPQDPKDDFRHGGSDAPREGARQRDLADVCPKCGKNHGSRPCLAGQRVCFRCGKPGHMVRDCNVRSPQLNATFRPQHHGRVFTINAEDTSRSDAQGKRMVYI